MPYTPSEEQARTTSTPTGRSVSCSGVLVMEDRHRRAERDHRERQERRNGRQHRRDQVHRLVGQRRDDFFLEGQLDSVGQRLQDAPRADPVGTDPVLHPADDLALEHDREQGHDDQEDEDRRHLDQDDPDRVLAEDAESRWHRGRRDQLRLMPGLPSRPRDRTVSAPGAARVRAARRPGGWSAARPLPVRQSRDSTGSADRTAGRGHADAVALGHAEIGRGRWPTRPATAWRCRPGSARRPAWRRRRSVPARSPARPAGGVDRTRRHGRRGRPGPVPTPSWASSARAARDGQPQVDVQFVGQRVQHPAVGHLAGAGQGQVERTTPTLPGHEPAGLLGRRRHREHHVGALGHRAVRAAPG